MQRLDRNHDHDNDQMENQESNDGTLFEQGTAMYLLIFFSSFGMPLK